MPKTLQERLATRQSEVWQQDLHWEKQERIFIQAPSGVGKTTLIHILYGLRRDVEGEVMWADEKLSVMHEEQLSELRRGPVSIIFQDMRLFPELSAWENLEIKRVLTNTVSEAELHEMLALLGIADRAQRPAATLSYGEQQRVAIIRALLQPFHWLLMDEPFSHLDEANKRRAAELIETFVQRNRASLLLADLDGNDYFSYTLRLSL